MHFGIPTHFSSFSGMNESGTSCITWIVCTDSFQIISWYKGNCVNLFVPWGEIYVILVLEKKAIINRVSKVWISSPVCCQFLHGSEVGRRTSPLFDACSLLIHGWKPNPCIMKRSVFCKIPLSQVTTESTRKQIKKNEMFQMLTWTKRVFSQVFHK